MYDNKKDHKTSSSVLHLNDILKLMGREFDIYNFGPKLQFHILFWGRCSKTNFWDERGYCIFFDKWFTAVPFIPTLMSLICYVK